LLLFLLDLRLLFPVFLWFVILILLLLLLLLLLLGLRSMLSFVLPSLLHALA
jgi:hypothetical protein